MKHLGAAAREGSGKQSQEVEERREGQRQSQSSIGG